MPKSSAKTNASAASKQKTKPKPGPGRNQAQSSRDAPLSTGTRQATSRAPRFEAQPRGGARIRHREYIGDVNGSIAFTLTSFPINPGMSQTFPWLSQIARQYESYKFHGLTFEFDGGRSANTDGKLALAVDFDAADAVPTSKLDLLNYDGVSSKKIWEDNEYICRAENLRKALTSYVRTAPLAANLDIKTYDIGNFLVSTVGQASAAFAGELFVVYDVEFMTPQLSSPSLAEGARVSGTAGLSTTVLFGTNAVVDPDSTLSVSVNGAGNTVTFNEAFDGIATCNCVGSTCNTIAAGAGTATASVQGTNSAGTNGLAVIYITATAGQTFIPTCSGFSGPVSASWWFAAFPSAAKA